MNKSIILSEQVRASFSSQATLAVLGHKLHRMKVFEPITQRVQIAQKTVKYPPTEKLRDAFISLLAGAHGLVEINKRLRADVGLQRAFGRLGCAEQSVVQDTLDACTAENVTQMEAALTTIFQRHSRSYRHDYQLHWQLLDVDLTGRPCGKKAAFASKGYFAHQRNRRGRQEGYVLATWYEELVVKHVYAGTTQLHTVLQPLVTAAEARLKLDEGQRRRTVLRIDAGGGSVADVNWALTQGYQVHGKDCSGTRAKVLAASVRTWFSDPQNASREMGWVTLPADMYCRPVRRIAVRCRKNNGQWGYGVIVSALAPADVLRLTGGYVSDQTNPQAVLLAYVQFYDQRGGGVETAIKQDKQGLHTAKRNKKRFEAQQILSALEVLAHNVLIWARNWLAPRCPKVAQLGLKRLVRDVFRLDGILVFDQRFQLVHVILNRADPWAQKLRLSLTALLAQEQVAISLGET
jgi:hypothetical protein